MGKAIIISVFISFVICVIADFRDYVKKRRKKSIISDNELTEREKYIFDALIASRQVQDFLWAEGLKKVEPEKLKDVCVDMFQKRIDKLKEIDFNNKSSKIELRKRILQTAAISIKLLEQLEK